MANTTTAPSGASSILLRSEVGTRPVKAKSSGIFGILRILEGVGIAIASILAPESIPALVAIAATDIGSNLVIDLVEQSNNIQTDLYGNLIVNTFANAIPFVSTIKNIARETELVAKTAEALEQFRDIEIVEAGRSETLNLLKSKQFKPSDLKQLSTSERNKIFKEAKSIRNELVSGLLEQANRTSDITRLTQISKPLELLGVSEGVSNSAGKIELGTNFLRKNDSLFEEIQTAAREDVLSDLEEYGDWTADEFSASFINKNMKGAYSLLSYNDSLSKNGLIRMIGKDIKNSPKRLWDYITWKETRDFIKNRSSLEGMNLGQKIVKYFSSEAGYKATQRVQLFNANDFARETINRPLGWLRKIVVKQSKSYREVLEKKFNVKKLGKLTSAWERNIIPFPDSEWLSGCRIIKGDPTGIINHLVIMHKNPKYRPVFIKNVPKSVVIDFITATSKGEAYHRLFAWSKNGQDIIRLGWTSAALFSALPLNALRNILSTITNIKSTIKFGVDQGQNYAKAYVKKYAETIEKNAPARVGRTFATFLLGGSGILAQQAGKFTSATIKSFGIGKAAAGKGTIHFNGQPLITAALSSIRTASIRKTQQRGIQSARQRRVAKRYLGRLKGVQSILGIRSARNK